VLRDCRGWKCGTKERDFEESFVVKFTKIKIYSEKRINLRLISISLWRFFSEIEFPSLSTTLSIFLSLL
jgi:hypothetical protein